MKLKTLYTFFMLLAATVLFAQKPRLETSADSTRIKIGSQFNLTLKATVDTAATVNFPEGKNFGQLEVLESYPIDTVKNGALYELIKKYGLTQFDSGRYVVPRLPVVINGADIKSDSIPIEVMPVQVDTLKQKLYDIKDIATAESNNSFWWWVLLGVVVAALIGFGVWWFIKKRKKPEQQEEQVHYATPIEKATTQLKVLENKALLQRGAVKDYYSELTDIARTYIEEAIHIPAMESTTGELIEAMRSAVRKKNMKLTQETFEELEKVLRNADMVKFAKVRPVDFEVAEDRNRIEKSIVKIDQSIPQEKEEDEEHTLAWLEAQRLAEKKKKRNRRIAISIAAAVVLFGTMAFFAVRYVMREYITGVPTKELLEGEWVKSSYGSPPVTIETPKVLKRENVEDMVPKEAAALIKDMQMFGQGAMYDTFYALVSTVSYSQQVEIDLNLAVDGMLKTMEARGGKDIIVKTESFSPQGGPEGMRAYGNYSMPTPGTGTYVRMYYELYLFKNQRGMQMIMISYREGDEYAPQILDRIKNSIELYKAE